MTKARTQAEKRRAKKSSLPGLAPTPKRGKDGCFLDRTRQQPEEPPARLNLDRRAREMGETPDAGKSGDKVRAKYSHTGYGSEATAALVIEGGTGSENELLALYGDFCARYVAWCRSLGINPYAKTSKTEMMPQPFEVDPHARIDMRTEDERDMSAWQKYRPYDVALKAIGPAHEQAIWRAFHGWRHMHNGGRLTLSGRLFVAAMKAMGEVIK